MKPYCFQGIGKELKILNGKHPSIVSRVGLEPKQSSNNFIMIRVCKTLDVVRICIIFFFILHYASVGQDVLI